MNKLAVLAASGLMLITLNACADTVQYLTFTSDVPGYTGGSGSLTLTGTIDPQNFSSLTLSGLDVTLDGLKLTGASGYESYLQGELSSFEISAFATSGPNQLEFFLNPDGTIPANNVFSYNMYAEYDDPDQSFYDSGTVTLSSTPPSSVTPEPSSFALLGTGLLGVAGAARRRLA